MFTSSKALQYTPMVSYSKLYELFELFLDPIEHTLLVNPITRPESGITYSRDSYLNWVRVKPVDPVSRHQVNDLLPVQNARLIPQILEKLKEVFREDLLSLDIVRTAIKKDDSMLVSLSLDCGLKVQDKRFLGGSLLVETLREEAQDVCALLVEKDPKLMQSPHIHGVMAHVPFCMKNHKNIRVLKWLFSHAPTHIPLEEIVVDKVSLKRFFRILGEEEALEQISSWFSKRLGSSDAAKGVSVSALRAVDVFPTPSLRIPSRKSESGGLERFTVPVSQFHRRAK